MKLLKKISELCADLEKWRERSNGERFGYGLDKYKPDQKFDYPEAYALWGRGFLVQYRITKDKSFLQKAENCTKWLIENSIGEYSNPCWGLPWNLDSWNVERNTGYLITTVCAGDLFLDLFDIAHKQDHLAYLEKIAKWIIVENKGQVYKNGFCFNYTNHPNLNFFIPNPSAKAAGFFARLFRATGDKSYGSLALEVINTIIRAQLPNGAWDYSSSSIVKDTIHIGYINDGLFDTFQVFKEDYIKKSFLEGVKYLNDTLLRKDGSMFLRGRLILNDVFKLNFPIFKKEIIDNISLNREKYLCPLGGYASGIRSFTIASCFDADFLENSLRINNYVANNLLTSSGGYSYSLIDRLVYIRHQAYYYHALSVLLERIKDLDL